MLIFSNSSSWPPRHVWDESCSKLCCLTYLLPTKIQVKVTVAVLLFTLLYLIICSGNSLYFHLHSCHVLSGVFPFDETRNLCLEALSFLLLSHFSSHTPPKIKKRRGSVLKSCCDIWCWLFPCALYGYKEHYLNVNFSEPVIVDFSMDWCDET